ncbi:MAG TPA: hypothetical protein PLY68_03125 [Myxococcota bacterium]|nr:hypothetical protein [Myxococcota bacterium]
MKQTDGGLDFYVVRTDSGLQVRVTKGLAPVLVTADDRDGACVLKVTKEVNLCPGCGGCWEGGYYDYELRERSGSVSGKLNYREESNCPEGDSVVTNCQQSAKLLGTKKAKPVRKVRATLDYHEKLTASADHGHEPEDFDNWSQDVWLEEENIDGRFDLLISGLGEEDFKVLDAEPGIRVSFESGAGGEDPPKIYIVLSDDPTWHPGGTKFRVMQSLDDKLVRSGTGRIDRRKGQIFIQFRPVDGINYADLITNFTANRAGEILNRQIHTSVEMSLDFGCLPNGRGGCENWYWGIELNGLMKGRVAQTWSTEVTGILEGSVTAYGVFKGELTRDIDGWPPWNRDMTIADVKEALAGLRETEMCDFKVEGRADVSFELEPGGGLNEIWVNGVEQLGHCEGRTYLFVGPDSLANPTGERQKVVFSMNFPKPTCAIECRENGACTWSNGACVPQSPADCQGSYGCKERGDCTLIDGVCGRESTKSD